MVKRLREIIAGLHPDLQDAPVFREAIEDEESRAASEVDALQEKLEALEVEELETIAQRDAELTDAAAEYTEIVEALNPAKKRLAEAAAAVHGARHGFASRKAYIRSEIRRLSNREQQIEDRQYRWLKEHADWPKRLKEASATVTGEDGNEHVITITNSKSIGARMVALVELIRKADELRYSARKDVLEVLDAMYAKLPAVEEPGVAPLTLAQKTKAALKKLNPRDKSLLRRGILNTEDILEVN